MIKTILVPVDVSEGQQDSDLLQMAWQLAQMHGSKIEVVTVVPDYPTSLVSQFYEDGYHEKVVEHATSLVHQLVTSVLGDKADGQIDHMVAIGGIYEQILKAADTVGADLIVIGAHKPGLKDFLLGPNAARVVRHARCSVHVVRS